MANMLKISEAASLGLHATAVLAACEDRITTTPEIAEWLDVSEAHLAKVLQRLHKAQLVESVRGPKGGFMLSKPADEISLLEVYEAIEGRLVADTCLLATPLCDENECILGNLLEKVYEQVNGYLSRTTLADVAGILQKALGNRM
jgi:Rrf2 family protein